MCGIAGFWKNDSLNTEEEYALYEMTKSLYHRGPDGYGYHLDEDGAAMGHARLSIIDLESGKQPLYGANQQYILTINGELYDYKKIRTDLQLDGFQFQTKSDSEIILPLYEKHGLNFVNHLRGEFAIALLDKKEGQMILVRDRFGVKPLYYHIGNDSVYYGSEIKALFANPSVPRKFSNESALHQLMHTMVPGTTAYENIHALKPGHMLVIKKRGNGFDIKEHKYWDMNFPMIEERNTSLPAEYHIHQVREQLSDAVAQRLEADVPVGCYLSGGIDSCSMLGLGSSLQQSPIKAFTISFDNKDYDEAHIAKEMAEKVGAEHIQINLSANELYGENYIKTVWHSERTFYNTLGVAKYCMSKKVHETGIKTVITGEGSDELFGGYPALKKDMLLHGTEYASEEERLSHQALLEQNNKLFKGAILSEMQVSHAAMDAKLGFTPSWIQPWMQTLEIARPLLHDDILHELRKYDPIEAIADSLDVNQIAGRHALDKAQYSWSKTMLECQILNWGGDRVDMANSMESRPAFLDHHVAKIATEIPPHYRINGNTEKWVLREAMKNILPETLYKREKFAFMAPPAHTDDKKSTGVDLLLARFLNEDKIKEVGLFDLKRLNQFLKEYKLDKDPVSLVRKDALLNHIIGLHILHDQFIKESVYAI